MPSEVVGDLDSVRPEVAAYYASRGCPMVRLQDQEHTDLHKALLRMLDQQRGRGDEAARLAHADGRPHPPQPWLAVACALGGRLDHDLGALSTLHALCGGGEGVAGGGGGGWARATLLGRHSAATLLPPGAHTLTPCPRREGGACGLVPFGAWTAETHKIDQLLPPSDTRTTLPSLAPPSPPAARARSRPHSGDHHGAALEPER